MDQTSDPCVKLYNEATTADGERQIELVARAIRTRPTSPEGQRLLVELALIYVENASHHAYLAVDPVAEDLDRADSWQDTIGEIEEARAALASLKRALKRPVEDDGSG